MDEATYAEIRALLARSATDIELRDRLLADPAAELHSALGIDFPVSWGLASELGTSGAVELSIASDELTDSMLEGVGGGLRWAFPPTSGVGDLSFRP